MIGMNQYQTKRTVMGQIYITGATFFKRTLGQSSALPPEDKVFFNQGETLQYLDASLRNAGEHYQFETVDQIAPWGRIGFLYANHIQLEVSGFANRLVRLVRSTSSYQDIHREAERIRGGQDNTCVAFQSEALRRLGISVPIKGTADGNVSLVTRPYSRWLSDNLGPLKVTEYSRLRPGDLCFSADEKGYPGYPAHTYIFTSYFDSSHAYVVDNQGNNYIRNLIDYAPKTPFAYALRIGDKYTLSPSLDFAEGVLPSEYYDASAGIRAIPEYDEQD
jgi:hypothetical protein